jgi:hypothetical protein
MNRNLDQLRRSLTGAVVAPGEAGYEGLAAASTL